jgi:hypothetical protein
MHKHESPGLPMGLTVLLLSGSRVLGCSAALAEICSVMLPLFAWLILMLLDGEIQAWSLELRSLQLMITRTRHHATI